MRPERPRLLLALLIALTVLAAASGSLPLVETARVTVGAPVQTLATNVSINLPARHILSETTGSQLGTATVTRGPAQYATGRVTFTYRCVTAIVCDPTQDVRVPEGVVVVSAKSGRYATQAEAVFSGPGQIANVPVKAIAPGASANTASHTIKIIENYPDPGQFTVDNPDPITAGVDPTVTEVIQQSDIDVVQRDLTARVADHLRATLMGEAPGMDFVADGPPSFNVHTDHAVGDSAPNFTMIITGKVGAVTFSESSAQALVRLALQPFVLPLYRLTTEPIQTSYQVTQVITNGNVTMRVTAVTVAIPTMSAPWLSTKLKGLSVGAAHKEIQREFPGSQVDISLKPVSLPFMPLSAGHISPMLVVEPTNGIYREYTLTGIVPDGITTALIQIDLEAWAGGKGPIDVDLYQVTYFQGDESQQRVPNGDFAQGTTNWGISPVVAKGVSVRHGDRGGPLLHMIAGGPVPGAYVNSLGFPVTAGATYTVTFAARVSPASRDSGQFVLIWGTPEQSRRAIPFTPAW